MLDNKTNQSSNFETKKWVEINDESRGVYDDDNQIKIETLLLRSNLYDYSDGYKLANKL